MEILRPLISNDNELIKNKDLLREISSSKIDALKYLGAGFYSFNLTIKKNYYDNARAALGGLVTIWHFHEEATPEFIKRIEEDLIPAYSALIRKLEKKIEKD